MPFEINEPLHVYRGFVQHGARMDSKTGLHWINSEPLPPLISPAQLMLGQPRIECADKTSAPAVTGFCPIMVYFTLNTLEHHQLYLQICGFFFFFFFFPSTFQ